MAQEGKGFSNKALQAWADDQLRAGRVEFKTPTASPASGSFPLPKPTSKTKGFLFLVYPDGECRWVNDDEVTIIAKVAQA